MEQGYLFHSNDDGRRQRRMRQWSAAGLPAGCGVRASAGSGCACPGHGSIGAEDADALSAVRLSWPARPERCGGSGWGSRVPGGR
jgi:hypothetical protein